jgi:hypothetical protein
MSYPLDVLPSGVGFVHQGIAGEDLLAYKLVYLSSGGVWLLADASTESTMPAVALTTRPASTGKSCGVLFYGLINNNAWNWMPHDLLYVSTTSGEITTSPPQLTGNQIQVVGMALTETLIIFNPTYILEVVK